ncbi:retrotransposable element protein, partial [Planoprotostelium fungivorum]
YPESDAYVLDIPTLWQIHPVFHASLLTQFIEDPVPERSQPPPPSVMVDGHEEFVIKKFLDWKPTQGNAMQFLVKWLGHDDPKENSWMHEGYLEECGTHLEDFFKRCPEARDYFENRTRVPPKKKRRARS